MKIKLVSIGVVLIFLIGSLFSNASAELRKEDIENYSIGDKLECKFTNLKNSNITMVFTMSIEITGEDKTEMDGIEYDVQTAEISGEIIDLSEVLSTINIPGLSFIINYTNISGIIYYSKENPDTSKTVLNMEMGIKEETTDTELNFVYNTVTISRILSGEKPNVIDVGSNWAVTKKDEKIETQTMSGSYFDEYIEPGYTNTTTTTKNETQTTNSVCTGKKTITVVAGTFDEAYEIKINDSNLEDGSYGLEYWSSEVKFPVKSVEYDRNGSVVSIKELISYDLTPVSSTPPSSDDKTPGFELVFAMVAVALVLFLKTYRTYKF